VWKPAETNNGKGVTPLRRTRPLNEEIFIAACSWTETNVINRNPRYIRLFLDELTGKDIWRRAQLSLS
jgi:hypothetical protein